jgi:RHS repeat-associated protein
MSIDPRARRLLALLLAAQILTPSTPAQALPTDGSTLASDRGIAPAGGTLAAPSFADSFTGSASYGIPIEVAPGTGGLTPRLELRYSSHQRADSWVGFGWSLGASSIARSLKRGTPGYTSADAFVLDGQELVPDGSVPGRFHTRRESFLRIEQQSNGTWVVTSKDGTRRRYGVVDNARIVAGADGQGQPKVYQWLLAQEEDRNGNVVTYAYDRSDAGNAYLSEVRYTLRRCTTPPCAAVAADTPGPLQSIGGNPANDRVVRFQLHPTARPDQPSGFLAGFEQRLTRRLQYVRVEAAGRLIRCYELGYTQSADSFRTLLQQVSVHGSDGCAAATPFVTSFSYRTNAGANPATTGWELSSWSWPAGLPLVAENTQVGPQDNGVRLGDVDGDGRPDLIKAFAMMGSGNPQNPNPTFSSDSGVYLNLGSGFSTTRSPTHQLPQGVTPEGVFPVVFAYGLAGFPRTLPTGLVATDLTGDGRIDVAGALRMLNADGTRTTIHIPDWFRGTGSAFQGVSIDGTDLAFPYYWGTSRIGWLHNDLTPAGVIGGNARFTDLDGDGLPELVVRGDEQYDFGSGRVCQEFYRTSFYFQNQGDLEFELAPMAAPIFGTCPGSSVLLDSVDFQPCFVGDPLCSRQALYGATYAWQSSSSSNWAWSENFSYGNEDVDVNGDGLSDLAAYTDYPAQVTPAVTWLNDGQRGYATGTGWALPAPLYRIDTTRDYSRDLGVRFADVNGDGRVDLVRAREGTKNVWLNDGDVEDGGAWLQQPGSSPWQLPSGEVFVDSEGRDRGVRLVDIDGDGMTDLLRSEGSLSRVYLNRGEVPDLLTQVTTPIGGSVAFQYTPSTAFDNTGADSIPDLPAVLQLVTRIEVDDGPGSGPPIVTTLAYADGVFDAADRELRGFREVKATRADRQTITHFHQDAAKAGLVSDERVVSAGNPAQCWSGVDNGYTSDATPPYVSLLISQVRLEFDGQPCSGAGSNPRRTRVGFVYGPSHQDPYGNLTQIIDYGDVDAQSQDVLPADTRLTQLVYTTPNDAIHLVDRVRFRTLYDGPLDGPTLVSQTQLFYDNDSAGTATPTLGRLTQRREVLSESGKPNPTTIFGYDDYGNVVSVRDPRHVAGQRAGGPTTYEYDTAFRTFRTAAVDPKGHRTEYRYSTAGACAVDYPAGSGQVQDERGPNELAAGTRWLRCYDVHGRPVVERGPGGVVETLQGYQDAPGSVAVTAQRLVKAASHRTSTTYLDGLGRPTRVETDGPQGKEIVERRLYDAAGRLHQASAPRLCTDPAVPASCEQERLTTYAYDPLDRIVSETLPGAGRISTYVRDRGWLLTTDANGNRRSVFHDAFGNAVLVTEFDGVQGGAETPYVSWYGYRSDDQLASVTDHRGNHTSIGYDLLGRRRSLDDPDTGLTQYDYDANGNLLTQTDAAGQTIRWTYDELDRPDVRRIGGTNGPIESDWDYDTTPGGIGALTRRSDGAGVYTVLSYDGAGRRTDERHDVAGRTFLFTNAYDGLGQRTNRWYPTLPATKQIRSDYDARGYLTGTSGMVSTSGAEWDAQGRLARWQTPAGTTQTTTFDPATGRLAEIRVSGASGTLEELDFGFDPGDRVTSITDVQDGALTRTFQYWRIDRLRYASGPQGGYYSYDPIGNLLCKGSSSATQCTGGSAVAMTYPTAAGADRPHAPLTVNGAPVGYGATGNLETLGTRRYGYDALGRLRSANDDQRLLGDYRYDASGRRARVVGPEGARASVTRHLIADDFEWDQSRNLARIHVSLGGTTVATYVEQLDPPQSQASTLLPAGPLARPWQLALAGAPAVLAALLLLWQLAALRRRGHRLARPALAGTTALALYLGMAAPALALPDGDLNRDGRFDAVDVLLAQRIATGDLVPTPEQLAHGDVAPLGGAPDQVLHGGDVAVLLRGLRGEDVDGDGLLGLVEVEKGASPFLADTDGDGLSDADEIALGTDPAGTDTDEDGFPDGSDATPVAGVHFRYADHLGSTILTTRQGGAIIERVQYEPFGARIQSTNAAPRFGFTGQRFEPGIGLYDYGARWYDPQLGRFLQPDPIVPDPLDPQSLNRYAYVRNDPVNRIDPSGNIYVRGSFIAGQIGSNGLFSGIGISFRGGPDSAAFSAIGFVSGVPVAGLSASAVAGWQGVGGFGSAFLLNAGRSFDAFWPSNLASGFVETGAELVSLGIGLASLKMNLEEGNYGEAAVDVLTTAFDAGLIAVPIAPGVSSAANAARRARQLENVANARRLGRAGEDAVRAAYDIGPRGSIRVGGRTRYPDGLNEQARTISEVKNVESLNLTRQLRDYAAYARDQGLRFDLYVRQGAALSRPLQEAIRSGQINLIPIPR